MAVNEMKSLAFTCGWTAGAIFMMVLSVTPARYLAVVGCVGVAIFLMLRFEWFP
jgi:hypothetical protein